VFSAPTAKTPDQARVVQIFKTAVIGVNILFWIFGCVLGTVAGFASASNIGPILGSTFPVGIIVLGVGVILLGFFGLVSAWRESKIGLGCYWFWLLLFAVILLGVGLGAYSRKADAAMYCEEYWMIDNAADQQQFQTQFSCCGLYQFNDTFTPRRYRSASYLCPPTSYTRRPAGPDVVVVGQACLPVLTKAFQDQYFAMGATSVAFSSIMLVFLVLSCLLVQTIRKPTASDTASANRDDASASSTPYQSLG